MFLHIIKAEYRSGHCVHLWFNDGTDGEADLSGVLDGPIFAQLRDTEYFQQFCLEGNTLSWPNGADFAPEFLHEIAQQSVAK